jgi:hypothetical protein
LRQKNAQQLVWCFPPSAPFLFNSPFLFAVHRVNQSHLVVRARRYLLRFFAAGRQRGTVPLWCVAPELGRAALAKEGGCPNNRNPFCRQIQSEQSSRLLLLSEGDQRFFLPPSLRLFGRIGPNAVQRGQSHCVCDGDPFARRHWVPGLDTMCRAISPNTVP